MARRGRYISLRRRLFIGGEGKCEQAFVVYLEHLSDQLELHVHLDFWGSTGGDTLSIVERSLENRIKARRKGRYASEMTLLDFDRLKQDGDRGTRAITLAKAQLLDLIFSRPNFEGLLLRLHAGHENRWPPPNEMHRELLRVWPEYEKPPIARDLISRFSLADLNRAANYDEHLDRLLRKIGLR